VKLSLTSVKYAAFASQETSCFEAIVLIDGKKAIHVSNDGHGGCDMHRDIIPGSAEKVEAYAKTLPKQAYDSDPFINYQPTLDTLVGDLLDEHLSLKDMRRALKKCVHFKAGEKILKFQSVKFTSANSDIINQNILKKFQDAVILNSIPEGEALKIWMKGN